MKKMRIQKYVDKEIEGERKLEVVLLDKDTGNEYPYTTYFATDAHNEGIEFVWNDGNASCDCNRSRWALGEKDGIDCNVGENRFVVVAAKLDGKDFDDIVQDEK